MSASDLESADKRSQLKHSQSLGSPPTWHGHIERGHSEGGGLLVEAAFLLAGAGLLLLLKQLGVVDLLRAPGAVEVMGVGLELRPLVRGLVTVWGEASGDPLALLLVGAAQEVTHLARLTGNMMYKLFVMMYK